VQATLYAHTDTSAIAQVSLVVCYERERHDPTEIEAARIARDVGPPHFYKAERWVPHQRPIAENPEVSVPAACKDFGTLGFPLAV
jgi:hypothetical protein